MSEARAMSRLLERPMTEDDLAEQTKRVASTVRVSRRAAQGVMVLRLGGERMGIPAAFVARVRPELTVHRIPHRTSHVLRGISNIDGELVLTAAIDRLLQVPHREGDDRACLERRTVVIESEQGRWAFVVDAVDGVHAVADDDRRPLPATVEHALVHYADCIVTVDGHDVTLLDPARLISGLEAGLS